MSGIQSVYIEFTVVVLIVSSQWSEGGICNLSSGFGIR